ncbi:MAG: hypothetical protein A2X94_00115 [Bdellovibrionales bacterium GWB1_55_8]|nr:MAG: hypothetical protein A2X94_00115 [Bdellovibrionales bacterium GWB1_55_8]
MLTALSLTLVGCVESVLEPGLQMDPGSGTLLSPGKFRLMGSHSAQNNEVSSATVLVTGIDVRSIDGSFLDYAVAPFVMDLMEFQNNPASIMARVMLPSGEYDLVRIHTSESGEAVLASGEVLPLIVPSGEQSGIKLFFSPAFKVQQETITIGFARFDLERSFVITGGPHSKVHFKPVVRVNATQPIVIDAPADAPVEAPVIDDGTLPVDNSTPPVEEPVPEEPGPDDSEILPDDSQDEVFMPWIGI